MVSLFLKQSWTDCRRVLSRCVSCKARIAILFLFMVWYIDDHFSIPDMLLAGAVKPFMFSEAIFMFAFSVWFFGFRFML